MADPKSNAYDFAGKIQRYIKDEKKVDIPLRPFNISYHKNGEDDPFFEENVRQREVYYVEDSTKTPQLWLSNLLFVKDALLRASAANVSYVLPNMLFSRQDRKPQPHVPISARVIADQISPNLSRIITVDLHAPQIQGFYPQDVPFDALHSFPEVVRFIKENNVIPNLEDLVIASPDAGGVDRARAFAQKLGSKNHIAFLYKRRSEEDRSVEEMILVGDVDGKNVLVVDDIDDTCGTKVKAAKKLKEHGALDLYSSSTHGFYTKGTQEICGAYEVVMTTNTHNKKYDGTIQIDISSLFGEAIFRAQKGDSISSLFN